jgi:iron(III) transport system permease protein
MTSLASFSAPYLFGGGFRVMTTQIVASKLNGDVRLAQVETVMLAAVALLGLWALRRTDRAAGATGVRGVAPARRHLRSPLARLGAGAAGWLLAGLLLLPHAMLLLVSLVPPFTWTNEWFPPVLELSNWTALVPKEAREAISLDVRGLIRFVVLSLSSPKLRPVLNSLWMAAASTAAALALGFAAARLSVGRKGFLSAALDWLIALPWAIPGTVFAIALATTFGVNQPWLGRFVLIGTPWILPLAYLVRSLPLTGRGAIAGLRSLDPALEEAASSLGAGRWRRLWRVTVPMLRPALAAGAGLAFITALGDFIVSIVLYTYDTRPISMEIVSSLRLQDLGTAAVYGVLLMTASAAAFLLWGRSKAR